MDPKAYLAELGYSNEDITAMLADEKQSKLITAAAKSYSEGRTLKQQAEAEKAETATFVISDLANCRCFLSTSQIATTLVPS